MKHSHAFYLQTLSTVFATLVALPSFADVAPADWREQISEKVWTDQLRPAYFPKQEIIEGPGQNLIELKAPYRAEDATIVPISIFTRIPQSEDRYIKTIHVLVDKNPVPLVGVFGFTPASGKADIALRIRVDDFSFVRAIAETNTGEFYLAKSFVRASGACSAPPPKSIDDSFANMGEIKLRTIGKLAASKPGLAQLMIKHPNITGLQPLTIGSRVRPPAHYINQLQVDLDGVHVLSAELTFSVSMDPSIRFFFLPESTGGTMTIHATDTEKNSWTASQKIELSKDS